MRGDRLKQLREKKKYTHQELADLLGLGYAQIYRYESGKSDASGDVLDRIASVFNVSVDYLLGRTDYPGIYIGELTPTETAIIAAIRRGERMEAIKIIASDEKAQNGA